MENKSEGCPLAGKNTDKKKSGIRCWGREQVQYLYNYILLYIYIGRLSSKDSGSFVGLPVPV
jgi:hypothetical protein